jgi:hypothetical protein
MNPYTPIFFATPGFQNPYKTVPLGNPVAVPKACLDAAAAQSAFTFSAEEVPMRPDSRDWLRCGFNFVVSIAASDLNVL